MAVDEQRDSMWGGQATLYFDRATATCACSRRCRAVTRPADSTSGEARSTARALRSGVPLEPRCRRQGRVARSAAVCRCHRVLHEAQRHAGLDRHPARADRRSRAATFSSPTMLSGGRNSGLEASVRWRATEQFEVGGALGLLHTRYSGYRPDGVDVQRSRSGARAGVSGCR